VPACVATLGRSGCTARGSGALPDESAGAHAASAIIVIPSAARHKERNPRKRRRPRERRCEFGLAGRFAAALLVTLLTRLPFVMRFPFLMRLPPFRRFPPLIAVPSLRWALALRPPRSDCPSDRQRSRQPVRFLRHRRRRGDGSAPR